MSTLSYPLTIKAAEEPSVDFSVIPSANEYVLASNRVAKGALDITVTPTGLVSQTEREPIDVVFVHDTSGSMRDRLDGQKKSVSAQTAIMSAISYFENNAKTGDNFYFVPFSDKVRTNGDVRVVESLKTIEQRARHLYKDNNNSGGTNYTQALEYAKNLLENSKNKKKYIVFLTDGEPTVLNKSGSKYILYTNGQALYNGWTSYRNYSKTKQLIHNTALETSASLANSNITMYSIGFADDHEIDFQLLDNMSAKTGGYAVHASTENLTNVFQDISKKIDSYTIHGEVTVDLAKFAGKVVVAPEANAVVDANQVTHIPFTFNFPAGKQPDPSKLVTSLPLIFKEVGSYSFDNIKLSYNQSSKVHPGITVQVKTDQNSNPGVNFSVQPSAEEYVKMPNENATGNLDIKITPIGMAPTKQRNPIDVVFVHDTSGSMAFTLDNSRKDAVAKNALLSSIDYFEKNAKSDDNFYFVPFDSDISKKGSYSWNNNMRQYEIQSTAGLSNIKNMAYKLDSYSNGGTNYTQALEAALSKFSTGPLARDKYVIFLTDGEPTVLKKDNKDYQLNNDEKSGRNAGSYFNNKTTYNATKNIIETEARSSATQLGNNNITMYSIAFANEGEVNFNLLQDMSNRTGGYAVQANSSNLTNIFNQISTKIDSSTISGKVSIDLSKYNGTVIVDPNSNYVANNNQVVEIPFKITFPVGEEPNPDLIQASLPLKFTKEGSYEFKDNVTISYTDVNGQLQQKKHDSFTVKVKDETAPYFKSEVDIQGNQEYPPDSLVKKGNVDSETNEFTVNYKLIPETIFTKDTKGTINDMKIIQRLPDGISLANNNPISLKKNGNESLTGASVRLINDGKDIEISLGNNAITYEPSSFSINELNVQLKLKVDWALDYTELSQATMSFNDSRFKNQEQSLNIDEQLISMRVYLFGTDYHYIGDYTGTIEKVGASEGEYIGEAQIQQKPVKALDLINEGKAIEVTYSDNTKAVLKIKSDFILRNLSLSENLADGATTTGRVGFRVTDFIAGNDVTYEYRLITDQQTTEWAAFDPTPYIELPSNLEGKVEIQVRTSGGLSLDSEPISKTVNIIKESIVITPNPIEIKVGESIDVNIQLKPTNDTNRLSDIHVEDPTIATYENGKIVGVKPGETNLIVTAKNVAGEEITEEVSLTVTAVLVEGISVTPNPLNIQKSDEPFSDFIIDIQPDNATNRELVWSSNDQRIVEIVGTGEIVGKNTGTADVTISSIDGPSTTITVNVGAPLTGISASEMTLTKGDQEDANKHFVKIPSYATNVKGEPTFESTDENIVDVDEDGILEAKRLGQATIIITVLDENGIKYSADLLVHVVSEDSNLGEDKY